MGALVVIVTPLSLLSNLIFRVSGHWSCKVSMRWIVFEAKILNDLLPFKPHCRPWVTNPILIGLEGAFK